MTRGGPTTRVVGVDRDRDRVPSRSRIVIDPGGRRGDHAAVDAEVVDLPGAADDHLGADQPRAEEAVDQLLRQREPG